MRNYVLVVLALASAGPVLSAESDPEIESVIVTAARTLESVDQALASVTVGTRDDIDRLQPHSVAELLAGLPGVSVANTGSLGKQSVELGAGTLRGHSFHYSGLHTPLSPIAFGRTQHATQGEAIYRKGRLTPCAAQLFLSE